LKYSQLRRCYCFKYILVYFLFPGAIVIGAIVIVATVVGAIVTVATVVGAIVTVATVVGAIVTVATVVGAAVVGAAVVGAGVIGDGVGAEVGGWQKFAQSRLASSLQS